MEDSEIQGEMRPLLKQSPASSQESLDSLVDKESGNAHTRGVQLSKNEYLETFLAYCKKIQTEDLSLDEKGVFEALSAVNMGLDPELSKIQKYGVPIGAGLITAGAAAALAELYMFDDLVSVLFKMPSGTYSGLPSTQLLIAGISAGGLILVGGWPQMDERMKNMVSTSSKYKPKAEEEQGIAKKITLAGMTLITSAIFGFKGLFAFVTTNTGYGASFEAFAGVTGPFFGVYKLIVTYHFAKTKWTAIFRWTEEKIYKWRGVPRPGEEERNLLRQSLANGLRKIIADKVPEGETERLFDEIHELHEGGKNQMNLWKTGIKNLRAQLSNTHSIEHQQTIQSSIDALKKNILVLQRTLTLATVKILYDFDKEGAHFPEHLRESRWYGHPPLWYRAAQAGGVVLGGLSAYAIGWAWKYITSTLDRPVQDDDGFTPYYLSNAVADTSAVLITTFYVPCLTVVAASISGRLASFAMNYNPVQNSPHIETAEVTYSRVRMVASFLNWCSHTYQEMPGALVGGTAMYYAGIPLAQQWWTLAPAMAVMGAGSHVLSEEVLQSYVTKLMNWLHKSDGGIDAKRQAVADLLKVTDDWLKTLRGNYVVDLKNLLDKDFKDLFKVDTEDRESGSESDDSRGAAEAVFTRGEAEGGSFVSQRGSTSKDIPLKPNPKHKNTGKKEGTDEKAEDGSGEFDHFDEGLPNEEVMTRPGTGSGLTALLLERDIVPSPPSPPSGVKHWLKKHVKDPLLNRLRGTGTDSPASIESGVEMRQIQDA
ncbi:MAG: hypothetical protein B7Y25_02660 [Alphaproteobacteria bacterium 16-39-46]|nr:MAG: hypothetical protein B7Y25_02660 [Alphaproteobacteria bacterium 16-39-46]OZA43542.1 MAG: hypothetical protein B7X84_02830 [Alphaproteobacteria bacterium 17-39-52]